MISLAESFIAGIPAHKYDSNNCIAQYDENDHKTIKNQNKSPERNNLQQMQLPFLQIIFFYQTNI